MMKVSENGVDLITKWEGFRSKAYLDVAGVWTIGYGHTKGVQNGDTITKTQAKKWLTSEIERHVAKIFDYVKVDLTQGQFDALASFHYNLGANILKGTTLLTYINQQNWKAVAEEMKKFNRAGGRVVKGLVNRRNEEAQYFLDHSPKPTTSKNQSSTKKTPTYTVKKGDTLSKIAKDQHTTVDTLLKLNTDIKDKNKIEVGQKINLPASKQTKTVTVQKGDTLSSIAFDHGLTLAELLNLNPSKKKNPDLIYLKEKIRIE